MQGFITEKNWKEIDRTFAGLHRFYQHLPRKPRTFLELLELYHGFEAQPARKKRTKRLCILFVSLSVVGSLVFIPHAAKAQAETQPETQPEASEPAPDPLAARTTLRISGTKCETNSVESALLRLKGITGVDVETQKGFVIVDYSSADMTPKQILDALAKSKGCYAQIAK